VLRSDNGLIFQSRRFRAACKDYRLRQEFITPYTPEQNGMIERFFRSLKEECCGNTPSRALSKLAAPSGAGSGGTTTVDRIRPWAISARASIGLQLQPVA
jgi:transposase InsO family protein